MTSDLDRSPGRSAGWPVGRWAIAAVLVLWVVIAALVVVGWLSWDAAAFVAAAVFTAAIVGVLIYDFAMEWSDPQGLLPTRFQLPAVVRSLLEMVPAIFRRLFVPVCFITGTVVGHFLWH